MVEPNVFMDDRPRAVLRRQYELERDLGRQILQASKPERRRLYVEAYDELYRRFPDHPLVRVRDDPAMQRIKVQVQCRVLQPVLRPGQVFLELGAGDCGLAFEVAKIVRQVYAVEVSEEMAKAFQGPPNASLLLSDGSSIDLPDASVDVAYSRDLMEHLHPDDAREQLREIHRVLKPGGCYVLLTPNRVNGPWDISRHFPEEPFGLHMQEYSNGDLCRLLRHVGFRRVRSRRKRLPFPLPLAPIRALESLLLLVPNPTRRALAMWRPLRYLLSISLYAYK